MLRDEVASLDAKLVGLIKRRACLRGKLSEALDKNELREGWLLAGRAQGFDLKLWDRLFSLLEECAIGQNAENSDFEQEEAALCRKKLAELEGQFLRLLAKRQTLLAKLARKGRLSAEDEKFLREKWLDCVMAKDAVQGPTIPLFLSLQSLKLFPAGKQGCSGQEPFALYSARRESRFCMTAPLSGTACREWIYLACASGLPLRLEPVAENEQFSDFLRAMRHLDARVSSQDACIRVEAAPPLGRPDLILNVGADTFNFFLFLCHYVCGHSRLKIVGEDALKLKDFSFLRKSLPALGARFVNLVPQGAGLPARVECSGILPPFFRADASVPDEFVEALILCASLYSQPFAVDLSACPGRQKVFERVMPVLEQAGASYAVLDNVINLAPASLIMPDRPSVGMEPVLPVFLLAMAEASGGDVELAGTADSFDFKEFSPEFPALFGLDWFRTEKGFRCRAKKEPRKFIATEKQLENAGLGSSVCPVLCSLAMITVLTGGISELPTPIIDQGQKVGFFKAAGLYADEKGRLFRDRRAENLPPFHAPDPVWAMAFALGAFTMAKHAKLSLDNPSIMRTLWLPFWKFLACFTRPLHLGSKEAEPVARVSRRIHTDAMAKIPEPREEDS